MSHSQSAPVGDCPQCGATIRSSSVLIEYERDGEHDAFAECPACEEIVHPT